MDAGRIVQTQTVCLYSGEPRIAKKALFLGPLQTGSGLKAVKLCGFAHGMGEMGMSDETPEQGNVRLLRSDVTSKTRSIVGQEYRCSR